MEGRISYAQQTTAHSLRAGLVLCLHERLPSSQDEVQAVQVLLQPQERRVCGIVAVGRLDAGDAAAVVGVEELQLCDVPGRLPLGHLVDVLVGRLSGRAEEACGAGNDRGAGGCACKGGGRWGAARQRKQRKVVRVASGRASCEFLRIALRE